MKIKLLHMHLNQVNDELLTRGDNKGTHTIGIHINAQYIIELDEPVPSVIIQDHDSLITVKDVVIRALQKTPNARISISDNKVSVIHRKPSEEEIRNTIKDAFIDNLRQLSYNTNNCTSTDIIESTDGFVVRIYGKVYTDKYYYNEIPVTTNKPVRLYTNGAEFTNVQLVNKPDMLKFALRTETEMPYKRFEKELLACLCLQN